MNAINSACAKKSHFSSAQQKLTANKKTASVVSGLWSYSIKLNL
ncbi:hypothetical protein JCM19238_4364 [Vibrio ponticus]|nr:hypothetical protein JCM19238_4364 [Vibrio ponticus]